MPRRCKRRLIYPVNNTWVTPFLNTQKNIQALMCLYKKDNTNASFFNAVHHIFFLIKVFYRLIAGQIQHRLFPNFA